MKKVTISKENNLYSYEGPILPIRTAAKIVGVSVHTLRMYEREGLIIPDKSPGNQRQYSKNRKFSQ